MMNVEKLVKLLQEHDPLRCQIVPINRSLDVPQQKIACIAPAGFVSIRLEPRIDRLSAYLRIVTSKLLQFDLEFAPTILRSVTESH
jgi:hypothetical protein